MAKYNKIALIPLLFLFGCATSRPGPVEIQTVKVPELFCPAPPVLVRPQLPIHTIGSTDKPGEVAVKYDATINALILYTGQLEKVIEFYKEQAWKTPK